MARNRRGNGEHPPHLPFSGGIDLSTPIPTPKTARITIFQSCKVEIKPMVDEDNIVRGYQLVIIDPQENQKYQFDFDQGMMNGFKTILDEIPGVGFPLEESGA